VRSLHTTGWNLVFEFTKHVWVTVELSDDYRATGKSSSGRIDHIGNIGAVHVTPPGETLDVAIKGNYRAVQFAVPADVAAKMAVEDHGVDASMIEYRTLVGGSDAHLAKLVFKAATRPDEMQEGMLMRAVVAHILAEYSSLLPGKVSRARAGISASRLGRVIEFVDTNLAGLNVDAMAAEAGLSPFHFAREFKRVTGNAPWSYVIERRLARAIALMADADRPFDDIARHVGFADASHLAHRMREHMGCSPSQARMLLLPNAAR
jgi:AraC family transcriptional regulator